MNSRLPKFYKHLGCKPIPSGVQREPAEWTPPFSILPTNRPFALVERRWFTEDTIVPRGTGSIGHADTKLHDNGQMYLMYAYRIATARVSAKG